jgi:hypothetical protein
MPGWDIEVARQKLLFFTLPDDFPSSLADISHELNRAFESGDSEIRRRCIAFLLGIADSLNSVVELHHNLQSHRMHAGKVMQVPAIAQYYSEALSLLRSWEKQSPEAARAALDEIKVEDLAVNKGDNLFIAWANNWESEQGVDPYASVSEFLKCFKALYSPDTYYVALFLAWERGETRTQFFNDYLHGRGAS